MVEDAEEIKRKQLEQRARSIASFPFEHAETTGREALATWQTLKGAGRGYPVVIGDDEALAAVADVLAYGRLHFPTAKTLEIADGLRHPEGLIKYLGDDVRDAPAGDWPSQVSASPGLSVASNFRGLFDKVHVALFPVDDWTVIPAHLAWGGWNECPAPELHIVAWRSWRERYGAELVGLNTDTLNLRVAHRPQSRDEALRLAREQFIYCTDIVEQGVGSLGHLAAHLMAHDWWYFWWD